MTQEVRVMLQLTLDVNTEFSKEDIKDKINQVLDTDLDDFAYLDMNLMMVDIIEIREEAEIYGNE